MLTGSVCLESWHPRRDDQWHPQCSRAFFQPPRRPKDESLHWELEGTCPYTELGDLIPSGLQKFRGYSPIGAEKSTGTDDDPVPEEEAVGVLSEAFDIGYELAMDFQKSNDGTLPRDTYGLYGDNQWPEQDTLAGFTQTYLQYCATVLELCRKLMRIFALSLDVPEDYFDSKVRYPGVTSRMMHYNLSRERFAKDLVLIR